MLKAPQKYRILHGGYVSEFTNFMDQFLAAHAEVVKSQKDGWNIYWDQFVDLDELKEAAQENSTVYLPYYFPNSTQGLFEEGSQ